MNYIHQMIDSDKLAKVFDLPRNLRGRKVEVIILPAQEEEAPVVHSSSAFGCLRKYANPLLIDRENGAWEQAVMNKYANS